MIYASKLALNSPKHAILDDGKITWSASAPTGAWSVGDRLAARSVEAIYESCNRDSPPLIPPEFVVSMDGLSRGAVPWPLVIPQRVLYENLSTISDELDELLAVVGEYSGALVSGRSVLERLVPCRIDLAALRVAQSESQQINVLETFEPGSDSMADPVSYSHRTATGRLTISGGPRILTLQKSHRKILSSRYDGGRVYQIDFVSLEPRVLRLLRSGEAPSDIYGSIAERLKGVDRRHAKLATLKSLYGASSQSVREEIGADAPKLMREINDYFGLESLRRRIVESDEPRNFWGRPIPEARDPHLAISHYAQSTAVDVSLMGFSKIMDRIETEDLLVQPVFVLHDALLIDCHPDSIARMREIIGEGVDIDRLGHFYLSFEPAYVDKEG